MVVLIPVFTVGNFTEKFESHLMFVILFSLENTSDFPAALFFLITPLQELSISKSYDYSMFSRESSKSSPEIRCFLRFSAHGIFAQWSSRQPVIYYDNIAFSLPTF